MWKLSLPGTKTSSIPLKSLEGGSRRYKNSQELEAEVRVQGEKIQSGRKEDKTFKGEGGTGR